jgi:NADH:ubiquinone oxidoreductase subunit
MQVASASPLATRPAVRVAVVMEREANPNRWQAWRFRLVDVVPHEESFGTTARVLRDDGSVQRTLHPNFTLELFVDQGKGYFLNLSSGRPVWFVMWRIDEDDPSIARPEAVSLSYIEADRWMSAEERVDNVPLPAGLRTWLQAYTDEHFKPEATQRRRPQSFLSPKDRAAS